MGNVINSIPIDWQKRDSNTTNHTIDTIDQKNTE